MSSTIMLEPELAAAAALENVLPDLADDLVRAKNYLKTQSSATGDSLYEHLADVVRWLVTHEPSDAADSVEQYSWRVRLDKFRPDFPAARLAGVYLAPRQLQLVRKLNHMMETVQSKAPKLDVLGEDDEPELDLEEDSQIAVVPDIIQNNYYFKQAGFGLPDCECHDVYMALKLLAITEPIASVRSSRCATCRARATGRGKASYPWRMRPNPHSQRRSSLARVKPERNLQRNGRRRRIRLCRSLRGCPRRVCRRSARGKGSTGRRTGCVTTPASCGCACLT